MDVRTKEVSITLVFFVLFVLAGHVGLWFVLLPVDPATRFLGFPVHYTVALLAGWPGLLLLVALYARVARRLDDEIAGDGRPGTSPERTDD